MEVGLLLLAGGVAAGAFGSLLGVGGGLLIVPLLTFGFGLPLREAVGVSLVCVIVTSSAGASVYLQRGQANLRIGAVLELFTAIGALVGGALAFALDERVVAGLFTLVLLYFALTMVRAAGRPNPPAGHATPLDGESGAGAATLPPAEARSAATSTLDLRRIPPIAVFGSAGGGIVSALLGIGGGLVMVPLMHLRLGLPLRVATATSNVIIGVTATSSAIVYLLRGSIDAFAAGPTAVGVFVGASLGSRLSGRIDLRLLRILFVAVLLYTAFQMARRALGV